MTKVATATGTTIRSIVSDAIIAVCFATLVLFSGRTKSDAPRFVPESGQAGRPPLSATVVGEGTWSLQLDVTGLKARLAATVALSGDSTDITLTFYKLAGALAVDVAQEGKQSHKNLDLLSVFVQHASGKTVRLNGNQAVTRSGIRIMPVQTDDGVYYAHRVILQIGTGQPEPILLAFEIDDDGRSFLRAVDRIDPRSGQSSAASAR